MAWQTLDRAGSKGLLDCSSHSHGLIDVPGTFLPSSVCSSTSSTFWAASRSVNCTKPKPRERPVCLSVIIVQSDISPYCCMYSRRPSGK